MRKEEKASEYFKNKFNCAQSVLAAFGSDYGIAEDNCLKIACAFGAGMGRQQYTCGAVTGALMVLGLRYGKGLNDSEEKKLETYEKTKIFFEEFKKENDTLNCKELLKGFVIENPDDYKKIMEQNLFETSCNKYVRDAVRIAEKLI
jgi:C_GCAxxG_C_C family probable redox protein